jgi:spore maturation protein CgeB
MGTYSSDRQAALEKLMIEPARRWPDGRMIIAGAQYPEAVEWPLNIERIEHLPPCRHRRFYNEQRFTLNITRALMVQAGYSPSIRLFEAAACARPIVSDAWEGLEQFFTPGEEILVADSADEMLRYLQESSDSEIEAMGKRARARVLAEHTAAHRAAELENYIAELLA